MKWASINPDIFGSMIQAIVEPGMRGDMGMHYTSVPNIMKALQPLFLLSLEEDFEASRDSEAKLTRLLARLTRIRVFDPACGSGNFLIIAYRELRKLEARIFARLGELGSSAIPMTGIHLNQFFGIELADFAAETAKLSLWIVEYQMNEQF
ncbi:MAG: DNA methyltransferase, partial [Pseudomonadales bacterium]